MGNIQCSGVFHFSGTTQSLFFTLHGNIGVTHNCCVCVCVCVCVSVTFFPPGEQVSGGGVLVMFRGLEPQLEGEEPRILRERERPDVCDDSKIHFTFKPLIINWLRLPSRSHTLFCNTRAGLCQRCHDDKKEIDIQ